MDEGKGFKKDLADALEQAFIDDSVDSLDTLRPEFVHNDPNKHEKVIDEIVKQLRTCDEFKISVAFITDSGIEYLINTLNELTDSEFRNKLHPNFKGGKILTTDYLAFTEPKALERLSHFPGIEIKMYKVSDKAHNPFHTKGYIFREKDLYKVIIGSSNLTDKALTISNEWNSEFTSTENGSFIKKVEDEFDSLWSQATPLDEYIDTYRRIYQEQEAIRESGISRSESNCETAIEPNDMQIRFVDRLKAKIMEGYKRGLLIAATGTGKTYAAVFAIRDLNPKHVLFVVHRTDILYQAIKSFKRIMPPDAKYGIITGDKSNEIEGVDLIDLNNVDLGKYDFVFATSEMLRLQNNRNKISPNQFDFVVIDEVHRIAAPESRKILDYFKPSFFLGMTATPSRSDDPEAIYNMFDGDIIYELDLKDALDQNFLCPFHYFGISDLKGIDDKTYKLKDFNKLYSDERINYILSKAQSYGYSGDRVRGLIFVASKEDGERLSQALSEHGKRVAFLPGSDTNSEVREDAIRRLEGKDGPTALDYILTINIFNEGIDIPDVNQVIMLRPTQSGIIFLQQLGRGLRKKEDKEYVVILDFIGNYRENFLIPYSLSFGGDKEEAKKLVATSSVPGLSSIEFDPIAKKKIYDAIDRANFNQSDDIKDIYISLKNKLGHVPTYQDFVDFSEFDPFRFSQMKQCNGNYLGFLDKWFPTDSPQLTQEQQNVFSIVSNALSFGLRVQEPLIVKTLIAGGKPVDFEEELKAKFGIVLTDRDRRMINMVLNGDIKEMSEGPVVDKWDSIGRQFSECLSNSQFKFWIKSLADYSLEKASAFKSKDGTGFSLYREYNRKEICQVLGYNSLNGLMMVGYRYDEVTNTFPIFVNYYKSEKVDEKKKYGDRFLDKDLFYWVSQPDKDLSNKSMDVVKRHSETKVRILIFVRKTEDNPRFYYLGEAKPIDSKTDVIKANETTYVKFVFKLDNPVRNDVYDYLMSEIDPK